MTSYWCEHAVLPGGVRRSVRIVVAAWPHPRRARRTCRPQRRATPSCAASCCPASPTATATRSTARCAGRTHDDGGNFWSWREAMYAVTHRLDPDTYHALAKAVFAEMLLAGYTAVGEFHYVHHAAGGRRYDDPNAMGKALLERGARGRHPDHPARHLLPRRRADRRAATCRSTRCSSGSPTAPSRRGRERRGAPRRDDDTARIGAAVHSVRAVPRDDLAAVGELASRLRRPAAARAPVGAAGREPRLRGLLRVLADRAARRRGPARRRRRRSSTRRTCPTTTSSCSAAARATACFCPTTERDLADGIGPARRLHDAGVPLSLGSDQHAVIDPFEEVRGVEMHERLESLERGRFARADLLAMATLQRLPVARAGTTAG